MDALQDLEVWRRACRFSVSTFRLLTRCKEYAYRDQLARSSLSVPSNIAEGYERRSRKERVQFLGIAKGSCGEAWTQLLIGAQAELVDREASMQLADEARQLARMIGALIAYHEKPDQGPRP